MKKLIGTHVDAALADRFAALAKGHGGKSALLRRLVSLAVDGEGTKPAPALPDPAGRAVHLSVRLSANEVSEVRKAAKQRAMLPSQWLRSVVRVRLGGGTQFNRDELDQLRGLANQVSKIGINLNQLTRAANEARLHNAPFAVDEALLKTARAEVDHTLKALRLLARGNVRYWEGATDGE